jgi:hypothetical protein
MRFARKSPHWLRHLIWRCTGSQPEEIQPPLLALQNVYHRLGWHHAANAPDGVGAGPPPAGKPAWRMIWHHMASEVVHSQHGYFRNNDHCAAAVALAGIALPRGTVRAWLATLSNMAQALLARPARDPVQRLAQRSLAHSLHSLLTQRFVNGASVAELMGYLTASALAAQRSGMADARLAFMTRLLSLEPVRRRPRLNSLLLRRIRAQLKDVDPVREAAVDRALGHAMISAGRWDEVEAHFRRAAATLAALGYGYDAQECQMQISTMWLHRGAFVQLGEAVAVAEQGARRTEQPAILRFALLFKLQLWLRTGTSTLDAAMACLQMIHAIPARRIQLEEIRLLANEALLLAARSDDDGVLQRAQEILDLSRNMQGGARIYPLAPLAVIIDAVLHVAGRRSAGDDHALVLARALTRRYLKLAGGMQIFDARCCLYQGAMAALEGRCQPRRFTNGTKAWTAARRTTCSTTAPGCTGCCRCTRPKRNAHAMRRQPPGILRAAAWPARLTRCCRCRAWTLRPCVRCGPSATVSAPPPPPAPARR